MTGAINTGMILEALNDKVDRDCRNVDTNSGADIVIEWQAPTAENDYTWYRLYKSGWVEQGGYTDTTNAEFSVTLPKEMLNINYTIQVSARADRLVVINSNVSLSTTVIEGWIGDSHNGRVYWEVKGMAATE